MKRKTLSAIALFLSFSIYFSCVDDGVYVPRESYKVPETDLMAYAKRLVGENGEGCSLIDFQKGNPRSRSVTDYSTAATPLWERAKTEYFGDEEVLTVPLQSEDDIYSSMFFEEEHKERLYRTKTFSRLVIRKKGDKTVSQVFTYLPGRHYAKHRKEELDTMGFSPLSVKYYGTILISGLDGKFQQGFLYERGVPVVHFTKHKDSNSVPIRLLNDSTDSECHNHNHASSFLVRLKLTGNPTVASRSYDEGDEDIWAGYCPACGSTEIDHTCVVVVGKPSTCDKCGKLKKDCLCELACPFCGQLICICYYCPLCNSDPCFCGTNNENDDEENNLGGGSGSTSGPPDSSTDTLNVDNLETDLREDLIGNCGLNEALDKVGGLSNLNGIIQTSKYVGGYDPSTKTILVRSDWDGRVNSNMFLEEIVHYLQDNIYENGTQQYFNLGRTNIEFEAKVIIDIYQASKNRNKLYKSQSVMLQRINEDYVDISEYNEFLNNIRRKKDFPIELYREWLNKFNTYTPYLEYKDKIKDNLEPKFLIDYGKKTFNNKCK